MNENSRKNDMKEFNSSEPQREINKASDNEVYFNF
jgi:hypothetical protein